MCSKEKLEFIDFDKVNIDEWYIIILIWYNDMDNKTICDRCNLKRKSENMEKWKDILSISKVFVEDFKPPPPPFLWIVLVLQR